MLFVVKSLYGSACGSWLIHSPPTTRNSGTNDRVMPSATRSIILCNTLSGGVDFLFCHYVSTEAPASPGTVSTSADQQSHNVNLEWLALSCHLRSWGFWKQAVTSRGCNYHPWLSLEYRGKTVTRIQGKLRDSASVTVSNACRDQLMKRKGLGSQCWRLQSINSWACCLGPLLIHLRQKSQREQEGANPLVSPNRHPPWS